MKRIISKKLIKCLCSKRTLVISLWVVLRKWFKDQTWDDCDYSSVCALVCVCGCAYVTIALISVLHSSVYKFSWYFTPKSIHWFMIYALDMSILLCHNKHHCGGFCFQLYSNQVIKLYICDFSSTCCFS